MKPDNPSLSSPKYRPDIDGLRAVAVLGVVIFHTFPKTLPGGFIGVDVFFVISGFLITTIILTNIDNGAFSFAEFYRRRVRRIFPALAIVLIAFLAFGWRTLFADEYAQLGKHVAAGAGFIANFALSSEIGYFDNSAETKPMLHLWSLGVEEQFYLVWPLLLWAATKFGRKPQLAIALIAGASFAANLILTGDDPAAAFFSPVTRFWELALGGLLAASTPGHARSKTGVAYPDGAAATFLSGLGFAALIAGAFLISGSDDFPGWRAAAPVLGAVMIIAAGPTAILNKVLLANRYAVWIGLISYPLYLWHWPLLSFARIIASGEPPAQIKVALIVASFALAAATYLFVEKPVRAAARSLRQTAILVAGVAVVGATGYAVWMKEGIEGRAAIVNAANNKLELQRTPRIDDDCLAYVGTSEPLFNYCRFANANAEETVAVIGDSHAHVSYPGIAEALKDRGINSVLLANSSCGPLLGAPTGKTDKDRKACAARIDAIIDTLLSKKDIRKVFIFTRGPIYWTGAEPVTGDEIVSRDGRLAIEEYGAGLQRTVNRLNAAGLRVYYVTENPELAKTAQSCLSRPLRQRFSDCRPRTRDVEARQAAYLEMARRLSNATVIESYRGFCGEARCDVFSDGKLLYADDDHLSIEGSRFLARKVLKPYLRAEPD